MGSNLGEGGVSLGLAYKDSPFLGQKPTHNFSPLLRGCQSTVESNKVFWGGVGIRQIEKDLLRTMPSNACFANVNSIGVPRLRRVLRALAWLYPEIGYCQGTGMVSSLGGN